MVCLTYWLNCGRRKSTTTMTLLQPSVITSQPALTRPTSSSLSGPITGMTEVFICVLSLSSSDFSTFGSVKYQNPLAVRMFQISFVLIYFSAEGIWTLKDLLQVEMLTWRLWSKSKVMHYCFCLSSFHVILTLPSVTTRFFMLLLGVQLFWWWEIALLRLMLWYVLVVHNRQKACN